MRRNPQNEYLLNDGSTLMSTTDTKSHITYANSAFIEASGYKEEHLPGEPHNLIRHPDMPAAAFADMWYTLQQGETWTGLVKKRRHNGDRYWVRANVTPVWQGESLTGYISVRNIPTREEIAASEKLYKKVRNNQLKHYRFYKGLLVRCGLFSFLSLFKCLSTDKRIYLGITATGLLSCLTVYLFPDKLVQASSIVLLFIALTFYLHAQIASAVTQTAETANEAIRMADRTRDSAHCGEAMMKETIRMMQSVSQDNGQIVDIISVIDRIAFQNNILALNAAVEAARLQQAIAVFGA